MTTKIGPESTRNAQSTNLQGSASVPSSGFASNRAIGLYLAGCIALAVIAAALLLSSCGERHSEPAHVAGESSTPPSDAVPAVVTTGSVPAQAASLEAPAAPAAAGTREGLPPEIALGEVPTVVAPGEPITITVYGTPDVTEMSLWDGLNDRQALLHDGSSDVWRVDYRVPLRPKSERIGLSVTARNDLGRWRRVWVFLQVASTAQVAEPTAADSVMEK